MAKTIESLEGIGPKNGKKLRACGCNSVSKLLERAGTRAGRRRLAKESGLDEKRLLKAVNMADLFRIKGVATQYAELLEAAGVDTVKELRNRNPKSLATKMSEVNSKKNLVRQTPSESMVTAWVTQAKSLKPAVSY